MFDFKAIFTGPDSFFAFDYILVRLRWFWRLEKKVVIKRGGLMLFLFVENIKELFWYNRIYHKNCLRIININFYKCLSAPYILFIFFKFIYLIFAKNQNHLWFYSSLIVFKHLASTFTAEKASNTLQSNFFTLPVFISISISFPDLFLFLQS